MLELFILFISLLAFFGGFITGVNNAEKFKKFVDKIIGE